MSHSKIQSELTQILNKEISEKTVELIELVRAKGLCPEHASSAIAASLIYVGVRMAYAKAVDNAGDFDEVSSIIDEFIFDCTNSAINHNALAVKEFMDSKNKDCH